MEKLCPISTSFQALSDRHRLSYLRMLSERCTDEGQLTEQLLTNYRQKRLWVLQTAHRHIASKVTGTLLGMWPMPCLQHHRHPSASAPCEIARDCEPCETKFFFFRVQALLNDAPSCHLRHDASVCVFAIVAGTVNCADASCLIAAVSSLTGSSLVDIVPTAW